MTLEMAQFQQAFLEECAENIDVMEQVLLEFDPCAPDPEQINTIFRAAHSIKGGAATFGFSDISQFTHRVETLLDEVRDGKRQLDASSIDLLLRAIDVLRELRPQSPDEAICATVGEKRLQLELALDTVLRQPAAQDEQADRPQTTSMQKADRADRPDTAADENTQQRWEITFEPHRALLLSGNEPLRILRELESLDPQLEVTVNTDQLPALTLLDPEACYLSWQITMAAAVDLDAIEQVFEWVEDECELEIKLQQLDTVPVPATTAAVAQPPAQPKAKPQRNTASSTIRVEIDKIEKLINLVGELVITQSMLAEIGQQVDEQSLGSSGEGRNRLQLGLEQLLQNTKELQESVLSIRMLPISFAFNRFPRLVRDLAQQLDKQVELRISGEQTELDKTVLEQIVDPLVHLVRNSIDHGLESAELRQAAGKPAVGVISLDAYHQGGNIVIEVRDDGRGLDKDKILSKAIEKGLLGESTQATELSDRQVFNLIFHPGFSTSAQVNDLSGRGVGMDVVRQNITELGGLIDIESTPGQGCQIKISLPLTLAILDGQLVKVASQTYVIPLITIVESIQIQPEDLIRASGKVEFYRLRDENIPILRLQQEFGLDAAEGPDAGSMLCVVEVGDTKLGLLVDELLGQQQVVIKSLDPNYRKISGISGATILGDGSVSLILEIQELIAGLCHPGAGAKNAFAA